MHRDPIEDERAFADTLELPVVADPDLCADEAMPDTVPDPSLGLAAAARRSQRSATS